MNRQKKVIIVDGNTDNLTNGKNILSDFYDVHTLKTTTELFDLLNNIVPDVILLNINTTGSNGQEAFKRINKDPRFSDVPIIIIIAFGDKEAEHNGLILGAQEFITTPFSAPILIKRIENTLSLVSSQSELKNIKSTMHEQVRMKTIQAMEFQNSVLDVLAEMVESRENVSGGHVTRTQKYLEILMKQLIADNIYQEEISSWDLDNIYTSVRLHDIGKLAVSDTILNKPSKLSTEEYNEVKRHASTGVVTLRKIEHGIEHDAFMRHAVIIAGTHHEKWDGSGYPFGLRGEEIPLEGRLMAIADVYDALVTHKPYRKAISSAEAEREIIRGSGTHFDPILVDEFVKVAASFAQIASKYRQ